jgi:hypothetical protein
LTSVRGDAAVLARASAVPSATVFMEYAAPSATAVLPQTAASPLSALAPLAMPAAAPAALTAPPAASAVVRAAAPARLAAAAAPALAVADHADAPGEARASSGEELVRVLQSAPSSGPDGAVSAAAAAAAPAPALAAGPRRFPKGALLSKVRVRELLPGVFHLHFPTNHLMASTFLRFQEHYESPRFRGKVFTLEQFMDWYASQQTHGDFTYYKDWTGFNIPSSVLDRFRRGDFDPLSAKEKELLALFAGVPGRFYLIGTAGAVPDEETLRHELAHSLFYTRADYRRAVLAELRGADLTPVFAALKRLGYHRSVWLDEANAYLNEKSSGLKAIGVDPKPYADLRRRLRRLFDASSTTGAAPRSRDRPAAQTRTTGRDF